jgi:hypothetical protein
MANGSTNYAGRFWRKLVIVVARRIELNSPLMCVFFCAVLVLLVLGTRNLWLTFTEIRWLHPYYGLVRPIYFVNRFVQFLCGYLSFSFFARMLQICYPKYYDTHYDRF